MQTIEKYSEQEIIERVQKGEKSLYELIVRRFNPLLYKIGRSYRYNHEDTQDLMQETYIDAYKNLTSFEGRSNFKTWIIRIMLNNCFRKKEKSSFKNEISKEVNENSKIMFSQPNISTEQIIHKKELGHIIENALLKIPEDYRLVFSLRAINNLSTIETSALLDISEANVKTRLNRAKALLRAEMEKSYIAEELFEFNLIYCNALTEKVMKKISEL
ncbi:MAG: sigma-70 family RNA polymerase sigma factor [Chitinophagaceae bacterium]|nr:MAG: sigma-70 family RNA polymerase sigma factor [Chitinophagaceae bacterium]